MEYFVISAKFTLIATAASNLVFSWVVRVGEFCHPELPGNAKMCIHDFRITGQLRVTEFADPNNPTENEVRRRSCDESVWYFSGTNFALITKYSIHIYHFIFDLDTFNEMKVHIKYIYYYTFETKLLLITNKNQENWESQSSFT